MVLLCRSCWGLDPLQPQRTRQLAPEHVWIDQNLRRRGLYKVKDSNAIETEVDTCANATLRHCRGSHLMNEFVARDSLFLVVIRQLVSRS